MIKLLSFAEWQEAQVHSKSPCKADKSVSCVPSAGDKRCVFCYETYVLNSLNKEFKNDA